MNHDIIKGLVYDRGKATVGNQTKHMTLVAMVIASDEPIKTEDSTFIIMGSANIAEELNKLKKYKPPYKLGDIGNEIVVISTLAPDDLEAYE